MTEQRFGDRLWARNWYGQFRELVTKCAVKNIENQVKTSGVSTLKHDLILSYCFDDPNRSIVWRQMGLRSAPQLDSVERFDEWTRTDNGSPSESAVASMEPDRSETTPGTVRPVNRRGFLRVLCGSAAAIAAIPALTGRAAAHFPLKLGIGIQPENALNFIDLDEHETVTVAVHETEFLNSNGEAETFDPTNEPVRYRFGSWGALDDGNGARPSDDGEATSGPGDGNQEQSQMLTLRFPVSDTGLDGGEEAAWLYWERDESGEHGYAGIDKVRVYG